MGKAAWEAAGQCRSRGVHVHSVTGEGTKKGDPSGGTGKGAPMGRNQDMGRGKVLLSR